MTSAAMHSFTRARRIMQALLADPVEFWFQMVSELHGLRERGRPSAGYVVDPEWVAHLHAYLGLPSPCPEADDLPPLWQDVLQGMAARGIEAGPMSYLGWNDADPEMVRAIWCLVRHLRARTVLETGVAHGVTSRFVLEALVRNGGGHLWSIDLPPQLHPEVHSQIGLAVNSQLRQNWTYIPGSSRRRMPDLLRRIAPIDLFIHDSRHTDYNVMFEMMSAWIVLRPGGAMVIDDIDSNRGFHTFCRSMRNQRAWVCQSEPIRPDDRRKDKRGIFGIVIKES